jgi:hypothetical protein
MYPLSIPFSVPGETLGLLWIAPVSSSFSLLKVLFWYAAFRCARSVVEILWRTHLLRVIIILVEL